MVFPFSGILHKSCWNSAFRWHNAAERSPVHGDNSMRQPLFVFAFMLVVCVFACSEQPSPAANTDPTYRQLRELGLGSESVTVSNLAITRDAAKFKFNQGTFLFLAPVNGKVTGAIFSGDGEFIMTPPLASESRMVSFLTKQNVNEIVESFHTLVLRFTDGTYDEIKKAGSAAQGGTASADPLQSFRDYGRKNIKYNYDARILQDVLSTDPGGYFVAFIHGQKYSSKLLLTIDPHGAEDVAPEEISVRTFDDNKWGIWTAFHYSDEYTRGLARGTQNNVAFDIDHQNLDTKIEKNGHLHGTAISTVLSNVGALRAVNFNLYPTLRVQAVTDPDGNPLPFIQEDKDHDADFWVVLPKPLAKGETFKIKTVYDGKEAVLDEGNGNYYPVARESWFPNTRFGRYSTYEMRFSVPKKVQLIANGDLVSQSVQGDQSITTWNADIPQSVAGFNLGTFKKMDAKLDRGGYTVESYANLDPPDSVNAILHSGGSDTLGSMDTTLMMKKPLAEAQLAVDLYTYYFGELPYKRVSMTQQTACSYGQSWPTLVYLPICSYFDQTVRHQLGLDDFRGYWTIVAPHEIAHQWWGHAVGFNSYRDQWLSEGFAEFSASLFLQLALKDDKQYHKFWKDEYDLLTEKNQMGFRGIDAGPLTLGYRLLNTKTGNVTRSLIYPKGAFVLQMVRMMMWNQRGGDDEFIKFMKDFVHTYYNKAASTEDFKETLEKHMSVAMDLQGNRKMDWFFNEYVYGTAFPSYKFDYSFEPAADGMNMKFKITQSNVDDTFKMMVPIYLELADGRIARLGTISLSGNKTEEHSVPLNGLKAAPKRAMLNYNYDVLGAF
jgi:Peptidase family M1 domain